MIVCILKSWIKIYSVDLFVYLYIYVHFDRHPPFYRNLITNKSKFSLKAIN